RAPRGREPLGQAGPTPIARGGVILALRASWGLPAGLPAEQPGNCDAHGWHPTRERRRRGDPPAPPPLTHQPPACTTPSAGRAAPRRLIPVLPDASDRRPCAL